MRPVVAALAAFMMHSAVLAADAPKAKVQISNPAPSTQGPRALQVPIRSASGGPAPVLERRERFEQLRRLRAVADEKARSLAQSDAGARQSDEAQRDEQRRIALGLTYRHNAGDDCDDTRKDVHSLAAEVCDNRDNNCDGRVDEGQKLTFFLDADGDGHGDPAQRVEACPADQQDAANSGRWLVMVGNDCDDTDPSRWQGCP